MWSLWRRLGLAFISLDSYGLAILLLVASYVLSVSVEARAAASAVVFVQIGVVWFVLRTSRAQRVARYVAFTIMALAAISAAAELVLGHSEARPHAAIPAVSCVLYLTALLAIVRNVATRDTIDLQSALGAIAAYLCIGLFFAFAYRSIALGQSSPFFGAQGDGQMSDTMFFSMTTLTTTGYGNLVPAGNPGQTFAVVEMMSGQLFLIVVVGKVIAALPGRRGRAGNTAAAASATAVNDAT
jgi:hypothetical protein